MNLARRLRRLLPPRPELPNGEPLTAATVGRAVGALLPEGAIVSDESVSSAKPSGRTSRAPRCTIIFR
jgi:hypothetical protein